MHSVQAGALWVLELQCVLVLLVLLLLLLLFNRSLEVGLPTGAF
jgi:hypothetical protein